MSAPAAHPAPPPGAAPSAPATWEFAGLLLTYWCSARCAFCYVHSGPDRAGEMSRETALALWRGLDEHAARHGKAMRVHLAGGEPFGDWPKLLDVIASARQAGLTPLEKVETNAYWATEDELTRARLRALDGLGMQLLVISADVYHQQFVPFDRVRRCVELARQVLGPKRVRVRWWDFYQQPIDIRRASREARQREFHAALTRHKDRLTGRAALRLAQYFARRPAEHFRGENCIEPVLKSRHVHIDGYGNVFPGVCSGIILGNAVQHGVEGVWQKLAAGWRDHPVVGAVVQGGSYELMRRAQTLGYRELAEGYANKCHLCTHVRQFLFDHGHWPEQVGPAECYANALDLREAQTDVATGPELVPLTITPRPRATSGAEPAPTALPAAMSAGALDGVPDVPERLGQ